MRRGSVVLAVGGVAACHVAAAVFFASHDPYTSQILPPCPVLSVTGWQCPGCGSTRALYSLLHGDVVQAFVMNPLLLASYLTAMLLVAMTVAERTNRLTLAKTLATAAIALVVGAAAYTGVIRNL